MMLMAGSPAMGDSVRVGTLLIFMGGILPARCSLPRQCGSSTQGNRTNAVVVNG
jgi:hypothetical protein